MSRLASFMRGEPSSRMAITFVGVSPELAVANLDHKRFGRCAGIGTRGTETRHDVHGTVYALDSTRLRLQ